LQATNPATAHPHPPVLLQQGASVSGQFVFREQSVHARPPEPHAMSALVPAPPTQRPVESQQPAHTAAQADPLPPPSPASCTWPPELLLLPPPS
jgi:hypothetical protein